jgi:hypothetical protein
MWKNEKLKAARMQMMPITTRISVNVYAGRREGSDLNMLRTFELGLNAQIVNWLEQKV